MFIKIHVVQLVFFHCFYHFCFIDYVYSFLSCLKSFVFCLVWYNHKLAQRRPYLKFNCCFNSDSHNNYFSISVDLFSVKYDSGPKSMDKSFLSLMVLIFHSSLDHISFECDVDLSFEFDMSSSYFDCLLVTTTDLTLTLSVI